MEQNVETLTEKLVNKNKEIRELQQVLQKNPRIRFEESHETRQSK